jgi:hypothetical protein
MKSLNITNYNLFVQYLADYVSEEISRGEVITTYTIEDAIDAYMGGAADEEETTQGTIMRIKVEYLKSTKMWNAEYRDEIGTLGVGFTAKTREDAIFALGWQMGRNPEKFSRPLGDYFNEQD